MFCFLLPIGLCSKSSRKRGTDSFQICISFMMNVEEWSPRFLSVQVKLNPKDEVIISNRNRQALIPCYNLYMKRSVTLLLLPQPKPSHASQSPPNHQEIKSSRDKNTHFSLQWTIRPDYTLSDTEQVMIHAFFHPHIFLLNLLNHDWKCSKSRIHPV